MEANDAKLASVVDPIAKSFDVRMCMSLKHFNFVGVHVDRRKFVQSLALNTVTFGVALMGVAGRLGLCLATSRRFDFQSRK